MGFAERLRALMDERGLSGNALARRVPCDPGYISRLASGKQQPSRNIAKLLDDALDAGGTLAALAPPRARAMPSEARMPAEADMVTVPCRTPDGRIIFVSVSRRLFLQGAAAAVTAMPHAGLAAPADAPPAA